MLRVALLAVVLLMAAGCSVISVDLSPKVRPLEEETVEGRGRDKILLVDLSGVLTEDIGGPLLSLGTPPPRVPLLVRFREELKKAQDDERVRAVVLRINSPGGTVTASDILYRELELFKRRTKLPVVAIMMDLAASGGYYAALAADTILAHPTTVTGSIGTIMMSVNAQGLMEKVGVAPVTIKSGDRKDMGSPFRSLTPEERDIFQSVINDLHAQFVARVVERRRMAPEMARQLADGRIYTAEQARRHGLIDGIAYMADAVETARRAAGLDEVRVVVYHRPREYRATYYASTEIAPGAIEATLGRLGALTGGGPRFLYLWWP